MKVVVEIVIVFILGMLAIPLIALSASGVLSYLQESLYSPVSQQNILNTPDNSDTVVP